MTESRFSQGVRSHYAGDIRELDKPHYEDNHDRRVQQLEEIFGTENIAIGLYRDGEANDVVGTLLGMIGIDAGDRLVRDIGRQNVSPHRRKVLFLSQIPKDARRAAGFLGRVVVASDAIAADGGRFMLSPQERRDLVARYQASNRALVARYGLADPGMFVELPDAGEAWNAPAPITRSEITAVFREAIPAAWRDRRPAAALVMTARLVRLFAVMMAGHRRNGGMSPAPLPDRGPSYAGDRA